MNKIFYRRWLYLLTLGMLSAISLLLYFKYFIEYDALEINDYQQEDQEERIILYIKGQNFGKLDETQIYINNSEINQGNLLKWNDKEIQIFIRKPFISAQIQLKKGNKTSQYIPVWNEQYLPKVQYNLQIQNYPVLETYRLISEHPNVLEIRGKNLGLRYQAQWLLLNRKLNNTSNVYFDASFLQDYRILTISEILYWSNQIIRVQIPQEVAAGPIFLVRQAKNKIFNSNNLYIPAAPNRISQQADPTNSMTLRLLLLYHKEIFPKPELWQIPEQMHKQNANIQTKEVYNKLYQKYQTFLDENTKNAPAELPNQENNKDILQQNQLSKNQDGKAQNTKEQDAKNVFSLLLPLFLRLHWPRNELNQSWHSLTNENELNPMIPAQNFNLQPLPKNITQNNEAMPVINWLLIPHSQVSPLAQRSLFLELSYSFWQQNPPVSSRNKNYNRKELAYLQYQFRNNKAISTKYQVPYWQFSNRLKNQAISPYQKALKIYSQTVRKWNIKSDNLNQLFKLSSKTRLAQLSRWPNQYLAPSQEKEVSKDSQQNAQKNFISSNEPKNLRPEQILLLLLHNMTELNIPARIIAGSISTLSQSPMKLFPYFWLEIYLPEFGWFQADPIAAILARKTLSNISQNSANNFSVPKFWGNLSSHITNKVKQSNQIKLAFFALQEIWQNFDDNFSFEQLSKQQTQQESPQSKSLFSWQLQRINEN